MNRRWRLRDETGAQSFFRRLDRVFSLAAAFWLLAASLHALPVDRAISQYAHRTWRIEEGLPNSVVRGITQTSDGSIWIGTYDGLARFNGDSFELFNKT
ncbi:MAG TPA: two-component regulator propeller domain-containing protein, partial [Thermoanaerobaculia bacterium]|nr:two-component regulator propeller domain-containing protein [Thermoanaerobaculia bacterium]